MEYGKFFDKNTDDDIGCFALNEKRQPVGYSIHGRSKYFCESYQEEVCHSLPNI